MPTKAEKAQQYFEDQFLTPAEVAALYRVDPKTVTRWEKAGKVPAMRTMGGHRRYRVGDLLKDLLTQMSMEDARRMLERVLSQ